MKRLKKIREFSILKYSLLLFIFNFLIIQICFSSNSETLQSEGNNSIYLKSFLVKVSNRIIKYWESENSEYPRNDCLKNVYLIISEDTRINSFRSFHLFFSDIKLTNSDLPSYIKKVGKLYVVMYLKNETPVDFKKIPPFLLKKRLEECNFEDSWIALFCDQTRNSLVVHSGLAPMISIREIQYFSCYKISKKSDKFKIIEDITVDEEFIRKMLLRNIEH